MRHLTAKFQFNLMSPETLNLREKRRVETKITFIANIFCKTAKLTDFCLVTPQLM